MNNDTSTLDQSFFQNTGLEQIIGMLNILNDTIFWIKDCDGRFMYANRALLEQLGINKLEDILSKTDFDVSPSHLACEYVTDDNRVMQGNIVDERLELNILENGEVCWFTTSKRPLYNQQEEIIGTFGTSRHIDKRTKSVNRMTALKAPVEYVRNNYMRDISITELANIACLSVSALERRFKKYLSKTPKQFITEIRLENACRFLIDTNLPIADIAAAAGFPDQSYFSRQFSKYYGVAPSYYRNKHNDKH